jgi:hypothetical protein
MPIIAAKIIDGTMDVVDRPTSPTAVAKNEGAAKMSDTVIAMAMAEEMNNTIHMPMGHCFNSSHSFEKPQLIIIMRITVMALPHAVPMSEARIIAGNAGMAHRAQNAALTARAIVTAMHAGRVTTDPINIGSFTRYFSFSM